MSSQGRWAPGMVYGPACLPGGVLARHRPSRGGRSGGSWLVCLVRRPSVIQLLLPEGQHMVIGPCEMCRIPWPGPQGPLKPHGREAPQPPCPRGPHVEPAALAASGWSAPGRDRPQPGLCRHLLWLPGCSGATSWEELAAAGSPLRQPPRAHQPLTRVVFAGFRISRKAQEETVSLLRRKGNSSWLAARRTAVASPSAYSLHTW